MVRGFSGGIYACDCGEIKGGGVTEACGWEQLRGRPPKTCARRGWPDDRDKRRIGLIRADRLREIQQQQQQQQHSQRCLVIGIIQDTTTRIKVDERLLQLRC